jgi:hypothetical protein
VEVSRQAGVWRDRARRYHVFIDGEPVGAVADGGKWVGEVTPGPHHLYLKVDWCRSPTADFVIEQGETARFVCEPGGGPWRVLLDATVARNRYIALREWRGEPHRP